MSRRKGPVTEEVRCSFMGKERKASWDWDPGDGKQGTVFLGNFRKGAFRNMKSKGFDFESVKITVSCKQQKIL